MAVNLARPLFLLSTDNLVSAATLTASEEASGYDADNLKVASYVSGATAGAPGTWRSTGVSAGRNLDADFGAVKTNIEAVFLAGTNLSDAAEVRVYGDDTAGFGSPEYNPGIEDAFDVSRPPYADDTPTWGRPYFHLPAATVSARYFRTQLTDTANPDGHLEAAWLFIGPVRQPGVLADDWRPGLDTVGAPGRSVAVRRHQIRLLATSEVERRGVFSIEAALGATGRFAFIPRPWDAASWVYESGLYQLVPPIEVVGYNSGNDKVWDLTMTVREVND